MKRKVLLFSVIALVLLTFVSCGEKEFEYESVDGGIKITAYNGDGGEVLIPEEIKGKSVVAIGEAAFDGSKAEKITVPDSVKVIEKYAFRRCGKLEEIKLP